uniref:Uncharacterized protein n=1 Tax=Seriola lalandi dorsalis TaxID=1841481 RepID=A0A3B4XB56_SERLL
HPPSHSSPGFCSSPGSPGSILTPSISPANESWIMACQGPRANYCTHVYFQSHLQTSNCFLTLELKLSPSAINCSVQDNRVQLLHLMVSTVLTNTRTVEHITPLLKSLLKCYFNVILMLYFNVFPCICKAL